MCSKYFKINKNVHALIQPNSIFIYNKNQNKFDVGNYTGSEIFKSLIKGYCICEIVNELQSIFNLNPQIVFYHIEDYLSFLGKKDI